MTQLGALKDPDALATRLPAVVTESSLCAADAQATLSDLADLRNALQVRIGSERVVPEGTIDRLRVTDVLFQLCMAFRALRSASRSALLAKAAAVRAP